MRFSSSLVSLGPFLVAGALGACGKRGGLAPPGDDAGVVEGGAAGDGAPACDPASCPSACCDGSASAPDAGRDGGAHDAGRDANDDATLGDDASDAADGGDASETSGDDGAIDAPDDQFVEGTYDAATDAAMCASARCGGIAGPLVVSFAQNPALASVGGGASVHFPGYADPACQSDLVNVVQAAPGVWLAFQGSETRTCCILQVYQGVFRDPCHGLEYDFCGAPINVSAQRLEQLSACPTAGGVNVWIPQ